MLRTIVYNINCSLLYILCGFQNLIYIYIASLVINYNILNGKIPLYLLEKLFNLAKNPFMIIKALLLRCMIFLEKQKKGW